MSDEKQENGHEEQLTRLELLEYHAWKCFEEAVSWKERLAALKTVAELVITQLKLKRDMVPKEDMESVEFYEEQLRQFSDRIKLLAERRGGDRPPKRA